MTFVKQTGGAREFSLNPNRIPFFRYYSLFQKLFLLPQHDLNPLLWAMEILQIRVPNCVQQTFNLVQRM